MAGFNLPITIYTPAQLDQLARAAFKVPALNFGGGAGGGLPGGGGAAAPGFDAAAASDAALGLGKLGAGLFNRDVTSVTPTAGTTLGHGAAGGMTTVGPGGSYSVTGLGDFSGGGASFGGGAADGGPVVPGKYYTVGERGPETFVPAVPGYIVPNEAKTLPPPTWYEEARTLPPSTVPDWETARTTPDRLPDWQGARTIPDPMDWATSRQRIMDYERDFFGGRKLRR